MRERKIELPDLTELAFEKSKKLIFYVWFRIKELMFVVQTYSYLHIEKLQKVFKYLSTVFLLMMVKCSRSRLKIVGSCE